MKQGIVYGNCQCLPLAYILTVAFGGEVQFIAIQNFASDGGVVPQATIEQQISCDILITQVGEWTDWRAAFPRLSAEAAIVSIPPLGMNALWPLRWKDPRVGRPVTALHGHAFDADLTDRIAWQLSSEYSGDELLSKYYSTKVDAISNVKRLVELDLARMAALDKRAEIPIADFVRQHWKGEQLFYISNHPTSPLLMELSIRLLSALSKVLSFALVREAQDRMQEETIKQAFDHFRGLQSPIHPRVADVLDLEYADQGQIFSVVPGVEWSHADFVRNYPDF